MLRAMTSRSGAFILHYDELIATGVTVLAALAQRTVTLSIWGVAPGRFPRRCSTGCRARASPCSTSIRNACRGLPAALALRGSSGFSEASFLHPLPAAHAVVASLALHHLHDMETKTAPHRSTHEALSPGGVLLNLDAAVNKDARLNALVFDQMAHRMGDHGISDAEARGHFASWAEEDQYFPLGLRPWCAPQCRVRRGRMLLAARAIRRYLRIVVRSEVGLPSP